MIGRIPLAQSLVEGLLRYAAGPAALRGERHQRLRLGQGEQREAQRLANRQNRHDALYRYQSNVLFPTLTLAIGLIAFLVVGFIAVRIAPLKLIRSARGNGLMNWFGFIPARQRITLGLVGLMVGTLLIASAAGFFPNEQREILNGRAKLAEFLAISSTAMASSGQFASLKATLDSVVNRDEAVTSIGLRAADGELLATAGDHQTHWDEALENSVHQMRVPVFRKGEHWGNLEICFTSTGGLFGLNYWAPAWLLIVMVPACFIQFGFFLRKSLKHLDPSDRVPQHVQDALDTLSVGLLLMNSNHQILFGNREFSRSVGRGPDELIGVDVSELAWEIPDDAGDGSKMSLPWIDASERGEGVDDRILHMMVDGERRTYSVNCSKVGQGIMAIFDDITLLEQARAAALAASESKSAFLANMSHEIRTPLNAVLGFTDVLRRGLVSNTEESIDHLNMIHRSGKHLLDLINDILDLSKIEAGKMEVESIDTRVDQIVLDTADVLAVKAKDNDLELKVEFQTDIPRVIQSDPTRLKQIITNLVGNAIKFTQHGSVTISTEMFSSDEGPQLRIDIIDTGIGMTPDQQARIFESFSQADETTTRKFGGTGLGLSISRRLAEALGGSVTVSSEYGKGSTFTVTHPLDAKSLGELLTPEEILSSRRSTDDAPGDIQRLPAKPVLVVDDGDANRRLIELVLERAGAIVTCAENGLEAIKILAERDFSLILMDMQMPVLDGYCATRKLRQAGLTTPVIALTGNAMKGDRQKCLDSGCTDFLSKPVDIDKLLQRAAHFLGQGSQGKDRVFDEASSIHSPKDEPSNQTRFDGSAPGNRRPIFSTLPMDDDDFRAIVVDFVSRLESRLDQISEAVAAADFESVRSGAHWLKGAGGTVGFHDFTVPAAQLEEAAKQDDAEVAEKLLNAIRDIHARIVVPQDECAEVAPSATPSSAHKEGCHVGVDESLSAEVTDLDGPPIICSLPLGDPAFARIVADFLRRLDDRLIGMQRLCERQEFATLANEAHWLKGSGGTVGFMEFCSPAQALEAAAKSGDQQQASAALLQVLSVRKRIQSVAV